jgi:hypothetical protein
MAALFLAATGDAKNDVNDMYPVRAQLQGLSIIQTLARVQEDYLESVLVQEQRYEVVIVKQSNAPQIREPPDFAHRPIWACRTRRT